MNERIRELAIQARVNLSSFQFSGTPIKYEIAESELEKFAELIVRECATICDALQDYPSTEPRHCAEDIRIHFGVEE